ncbi:MAG: class I SAM-dependent methyltransferase [Oscillospiraceae bacterium]|jgi:tRNA (adenine22-N1)-methyltransferase|nr:class I SAM-dependent methyltransferase [Oscillospiraceae bacterium]
MNPTLGARLQMTAQLIPPGSRAADIGTDHAYLPAFLIANGLVKSMIAADIGAGPLQNAAQTLAQYNLTDRIALRQSDGLVGFAPGETDCLIFAGMGGTLIAHLLTRAPWVNAPGMRIVAQPMRRAEDLRAWLLTNAWHIETETACYEDGRAYAALRAVFAPVRKPSAQEQAIGYAYYGALPLCSHPAARDVLTQTRRWLANKTAALTVAHKDRAEQVRYHAILADLEEQL